MQEAGLVKERREVAVGNRRTADQYVVAEAADGQQLTVLDDAFERFGRADPMNTTGQTGADALFSSSVKKRPATSFRLLISM